MRFLAVLPLLASMCTPAAQPTSEPTSEPTSQPTSQPAARSAGATAAAVDRTELVDALAVLREWDAQRARAWARSDAGALRALYVRGSPAGQADVRLLRAYRQQGLVVRRLVTQVFAVRVLGSTPSSLRVSVFDRVAGGEVIEHGDVAPLRSSRPVTRTVTFRLDTGTWRVSGISGSGRGLRAARP